MMHRRTIAIAATTALIACSETSGPPAPVDRVRITPDSTFVYVHGATQLSAATYDASGHPLSGHPITWSSRDTTIATVDSTGLVRGVQEGSVYVRAAAGGQQALARIDAKLAIAQLVVSPKRLLIGVPDTFQMSGVPLDSSGHPIISRVVSWTSTDPSIASVTAVGRVIGHALGVVRVTGSAEGHMDTAHVIVGIPVDSVHLVPAAPVLHPGDSLQLHDTLFGRGGQPPTDSTVTWRSTDTTVLTISPTGLLRARRLGASLVTVTTAGASDSALAQVIAAVASVSIAPSVDTIRENDTVTFVAVPHDSLGNPLVGRVIVWGLTDSAVATITPQGVARGLSAGKTLVIASSEGHSDTATLFVLHPTVALMELSPDSATIYWPNSADFGATPRDSVGHPLFDRTVTWAISDTTVAQDSTNGLGARVFARASGTARLVATSEGKSDTSVVVVIRQSVAAVAMTPDSAVVLVGTSKFFQATVQDSVGNTLNDRAIVWSTSDTTLATVAPDTGRVVSLSGTAAGHLDLNAKSEGVTGTATVDVVALTFSSVGAGCGVTTDSTAWCWGEGITPAVAPIRLKVRDIDAETTTCAISTGASAYCWGDNQYGALGDGMYGVGSDTAQPVSGGHQFAVIGVGSKFVCAVDLSSAAFCWGLDAYGQLGEGDTSAHNTPVAVTGGLSFTQLSVGAMHVCGITGTGAAYCWGYNGSGALGTGDSRTYDSVPTPVAGGLTFTTISAGFSHTCALTTAGKAYCWGDNSSAALGTGNTVSSPVPQPVLGTLTFQAISAGDFHTCAVEVSGGRLDCWGTNTSGQLGIPGALQDSVPTVVSNSLVFSSVAAWHTTTCGLASTGAFCWGGTRSTPSRLLGQP